MYLGETTVFFPFSSLLIVRPFSLNPLNLYTSLCCSGLQAEGNSFPFRLDSNAGHKCSTPNHSETKDFLRRKFNIGDEKTSAKKYYHNLIFKWSACKNDLAIEHIKSNRFSCGGRHCHKEKFPYLVEEFQSILSFPISPKVKRMDSVWPTYLTMHWCLTKDKVT